MQEYLVISIAEGCYTATALTTAGSACVGSGRSRTDGEWPDHGLHSHSVTPQTGLLYRYSAVDWTTFTPQTPPVTGTVWYLSTLSKFQWWKQFGKFLFFSGIKTFLMVPFRFNVPEYWIIPCSVLCLSSHYCRSILVSKASACSNRLWSDLHLEFYMSDFYLSLIV